MGAMDFAPFLSASRSVAGPSVPLRPTAPPIPAIGLRRKPNVTKEQSLWAVPSSLPKILDLIRRSSSSQVKDISSLYRVLGKKKRTNPSLPADSEAKRLLTLSAEENARVRKSAIDSEILGETVRLFIVEPNTFLLKGNSENSLLRASGVLKALGLGFTRRDAVSLWDEANTLMMVPLKAELPPRDIGKKDRAPRQRLLGFQALNMRVIQNFTGVSYRVDNDRLWLLGLVDAVVEASRQGPRGRKGRAGGGGGPEHKGWGGEE